MSFLGFGEKPHKFTITWKEYARSKALKCCGAGCTGCCYVPKYEKGARKLEPRVLKDIEHMIPGNARANDFDRKFMDYQQENICVVLRNRKADMKLWKDYFGQDSIPKD